MRKIWCLALVFSNVMISLVAQEQATFFNGDYHCAEGIYLTREAFIANTPDYSWEAVDGEMVQLPEDYRVQIAGMGTNGDSTPVQVYAISLDGFPYLYVRHDDKLNFHEFAGLRFRGRLSYFEYDDITQRSKVMHAYNPANGQPFRTGRVSVVKPVRYRFLIDFTTGRMIPMSQTNVANLIADETDLLRAVGAIPPNDPEMLNKLRQAVKLYNDRNKLVWPIKPLQETNQ